MPTVDFVDVTLTDAQYSALKKYASDMEDTISNVVLNAIIAELIILGYYDKRKDEYFVTTNED